MKEAQRIANYCWEEMNRTRPDPGAPPINYLRHVHCLRFLSAAFHGRTEALAEFRGGLFDHVVDSIERHRSLLFKNISVEAVGLLRAEEIEGVAIKALSLRNEWISENALNACRYIAGLSAPLLAGLAYYLSCFPPRTVMARYAEIQFSLSLSPAMTPLGRFWRARLVDVVLYLVALGVMAVFVPVVFLVCLVSYWILHSAGATWSLAPNDGEFPQFWSLTLFRAVMLAGSGFSLLVSVIYAIDPRRDNFTSMVIPWLDDWNRFGAVTIMFLCSVGLFSIYARSYWSGATVLEIKSRAGILVREIKEDWEARLGLVALVFFEALFVGLVVYLPETYRSYVAIGIAVIFSVVVVSGASYAFQKFARLALADRAVLQVQVIGKQLSRLEIERVLGMLKLEKSRLKYLREIYESGAKPVAEWTSGFPPNLNYDRSGTELAKLEARWLGI
jgi:hypothetical protein